MRKKSDLRAWSAAALLALAACSSPSVEMTVVRDGPAPPAPFGQLARPVTVPAAGGGSLLSALESWAESTGVELAMTDATRAYLTSTGTGLSRPVELRGPEAHSFVQGLLHNAGVFLSVARDEPPRLVTAHQSTSPSLATARWLAVPEVLVPAYAEHQALVLETVVELEHTDVRQLTTSMRGLLRDVNLQSMVTAGDRAVVLRGPAGWVAEMRVRLREIDLAGSAATDAVTAGGTSDA